MTGPGPLPPGGSASGASPRLTGRQRKHLRGLAHKFLPAVHVGRAGLTEAAVAAVDQALAARELVKVRLHEPDDKRATAAALAERTRAALCGLLGHTVILYRPRAEGPRLEIPT